MHTHTSPLRRLLLHAAFAVFAASLLAGAAIAHADADSDRKEAARRFFEAGKRLFDQGQFKDAAGEFAHAFREEPNPAFLFNVASAYDKAGMRKEALTAYKQYLTVEKADASDVQSTRARVEVIEKELAPPSNKRAAYPYVEATTRLPFQTYLTLGGKEYILVGAGARTVLGAKVYAMGLYLEEEGARKAFPKLVGQAGGADLNTLLAGEIAPQFIVQGDFGKHALLHFVRDVPAAKQRDAYRDVLGESIAGSKAPPDLKRDADAFLALFDKDIKSGQDLLIHTDPDGKVWVTNPGGVAKAGPSNLRLEYAIWDIWLGIKPLSGDLKRKLVERIDALGR